ncbi:MAG: glycosyltransferase family 4 protein, partial [Pseudomonadota bacterium]|nr:glycosyltransferase family 4 protein [Pseudomonadota bacterium]
MPPRLRVAVLNRVFDNTGGGAERYSIALVEQLALRHEVHVFAQQINHHAPGVAYHRVSMPMRKPRWLNQLWYAFATWRATRTGFDIVHSHENTWHGQVQTVHVVPVSHNLFHKRTGWRRLLRWIKVLTSPRLLIYLGLECMRFRPVKARRVVVTSASLGSITAATYPGAEVMTSVITPGVHLPAQPANDDDKVRARRTLGLPAQGFCLLFVGNDYRKKGLDTLLEVLAMLPEPTVLAVVGNPGHIPEFRQRAESLGIGGRVFFLGVMQDVGAAYLAVDALVHPTLEDTFAMVVLEAMAHALPVVVSGAAYCGISGLLSDGVNALVLEDPRNVQALGAALEKISRDEELRRTLGGHARIFASAFRWEYIARQQESVYLSSLA